MGIGKCGWDNVHKYADGFGFERLRSEDTMHGYQMRVRNCGWKYVGKYDGSRRFNRSGNGDKIDVKGGSVR